MAEVFAAALRGGDPFAVEPGRVVADVLLMAAFEFGDPVKVFVLVKADDFARDSGHGRMHGPILFRVAARVGIFSRCGSWLGPARSDTKH